MSLEHTLTSVATALAPLLYKPATMVANRAVLFSTTVLVGVLGIVYGDYAHWKSFGTGGTPPTLSGYFRMRRMGMYILFHPENLRDASPIPDSGPSYLKMPVPKREGGRPKLTRWTLPQRQLQEPIEASAYERLHALLPTLAITHPTLIHTAPSKTEGGTGTAIYVHCDLSTQNPSVKNIFYEIAHVHPSENSLHVYLSPRDARKVVEAGWGQRFPVSWIAPPSWVMVYAPRTEKEVEVVERFVKAAVGFNTGAGVYEEGV